MGACFYLSEEMEEGNMRLFGFRFEIMNGVRVIGFVLNRMEKVDFDTQTLSTY